jgi:uncharacterized protein (UPF0332 family)
VKAEELWAKAPQAVASARLLLSAGDTAGACNRAYYAIFDAARAALLVSGVRGAETPKTHSGLIHAFSLHLVKPDLVPKELGRASREPMSYDWSPIIRATRYKPRMPRLPSSVPSSSLRA